MAPRLYGVPVDPQSGGSRHKCTHTHTFPQPDTPAANTPRRSRIPAVTITPLLLQEHLSSVWHTHLALRPEGSSRTLISAERKPSSRPARSSSSATRLQPANNECTHLLLGLFHHFPRDRSPRPLLHRPLSPFPISQCYIAVRMGYDRHRPLHRPIRLRRGVGNLHHWLLHPGSRRSCSEDHHKEPHLHHFL